MAEVVEINEAKKILAFEATKICRGEEAASNAAETARKTFEEKTGGAELPFMEASEDDLKNTSKTPDTSKCRFWRITTATSSIWANATVRCSAETKKCWKKRPVPR